MFLPSTDALSLCEYCKGEPVMKKLSYSSKPKNCKCYYFTPTVDGKTRWILLGEDHQAAVEKYHLMMLGDPTG